jgi:EthD domain
MGERPTETEGVKNVYLIKRRATATREELIVHWFANHMPDVIARHKNSRDSIHADHYIATLFNAKHGKEMAWDGMAQLWYNQATPRPKKPMGSDPIDTFQEKAEPYMPWATREYVVMDGALPLDPPTLNPPFPCTRSGFFKVIFLVGLQDGADSQALFDHWLDVHVPNVRQVMEKVGGFRYLVSHSQEPDTEKYAGMAELYFPDASGWARYLEEIQSDGMEQWVDSNEVSLFTSETEMVGIP